MNSNDYEMVNNLIQALEKIQLEYTKRSFGEKIELQDALTLVSKAKALGKPSDVALIGEIEERLAKLNGALSNEKNLQALEQLYRQLGPEVFMAKVSYNLTDEQYARLLQLAEDPEIQDFLKGLLQRARPSLGDDKLAALFEMGLIKKEEYELKLTERGLFFARASVLSKP